MTGSVRSSSDLHKNYRPVSNLQYVSKLTKRPVFEKIHTHITTHSLYPEFQSSYRKNHSTETALVRVTNDVHSRGHLAGHARS